jgi:hypothetical protein
MQDRILYTACPLCRSANISEHARGDCSKHAIYQSVISPIMIWVKCGGCGHVFTNGYFTDEAASVIFSRTASGQAVFGGDVEMPRSVSARMIDKVLPYASDGIWLDVGVGNGSLLFTAKEYGFTPVGLDLREDNVRALNKLGIESHCVDIVELELDRPCRVISMADVLEHMPFPRKGLAAANRLMADGGVLFVSMPNSESIVWTALDMNGQNPYWGEIEHYHNFSKSRLYALLSEFGFEPVRYGISERYRSCMEVIARKVRSASVA